MESVLRLLLIFVLAIFNCGDADATGISETRSPIITDFKKPLAEWPKIHPFSSQKEMDYYMNETWSPKLTLEQNQKKLIKNFVEKCCDFSFKIQPTRLREIYLGYLDSGEYLIFADRSTNINSSKDGINILVYNKYYKEDGSLLARCTTSSFMGYRPIDFGEKYKGKFIEYFSKLAEDPVGCKLFRIALTKHIVNDFRKTVFIPAVPSIDNNLSSITCGSGCYICSQLAEAGNSAAMNYLDQNPRYRFITFSPEFFTETMPVGVIKYENKNIVFSIIEFFRESALFHEIIHSLHTDVNQKLMESINIRKRSNPNLFRYKLKQDSDPVFFNSGRINVCLFHNDEEYYTMYGLNSNGLDLLNESSYLAHRYGFIRASHGDLECARLSVKENKLDKKESQAFFQSFFSSNGDLDLFEYYLSPDSPINYPEFGVGQYECADLDPETGEKLQQT